MASYSQHKMYPDVRTWIMIAAVIALGYGGMYGICWLLVALDKVFHLSAR